MYWLQNTKFRMVAFIDIFKFYFIFVQTDCTKLERMGKRIISGVGCYFTIKFQINRTIRSVAVNTDFFIEMSIASASKTAVTVPFPPAGIEDLVQSTSVQPQEEVTFEI